MIHVGQKKEVIQMAAKNMGGMPQELCVLQRYFLFSMVESDTEASK